jgi:hypothetical protein
VRRVMSSTRKARGPVKEDASDGHEERNIWLQIRSDIERCAEVQRSQRIIGPKIKELEDEYAKTRKSGLSFTVYEGIQGF